MLNGQYYTLVFKINRLRIIDYHEAQTCVMDIVGFQDEDTSTEQIG